MACQEELPTAALENLVPVDAVSVEVVLPFEEFGSNLRVYGGFGSPAELSYGVMAHQYEGELEARTLIGLRPYPTVATVPDSTGATRPDSSLAFVGGKVVVFFDTLASIQDGPVDVGVGAVETSWNVRSASWTVAVDTVGDTQPWPEPGAGPVIPLATSTWDPEVADSVVLELDSAQVSRWADTTMAEMGMRLDALTEGVRLQTYAVQLFLNTRPSSNPDTLVDLLVSARYRTFVYEPVLGAPENALRVGGVPAWRTVFDVDFPETLDGIPELCARVQCPLVLEPEMVNSATLSLKTDTTRGAFRPSDSLRIDVRPVLEPSRLPKSPLGSSVGALFGVAVAPEFFGDSAGTRVEISLRNYISGLIQAHSDPELEVPGTIALLSALEPFSLPFGTFHGPGSPDGPEMRMILTIGEGVEIR